MIGLMLKAVYSLQLLAAAQSPAASELPASADALYQEALAALKRDELALADSKVLQAYALVDVDPKDALTYLTGRDNLLSTRRIVLRRLATVTDDPAPLCTLRAFLELHRDDLIRALGPALNPREIEGIHDRIREVDEDLGKRADLGKPAACPSPGPAPTSAERAQPSSAGRRDAPQGDGLASAEIQDGSAESHGALKKLPRESLVMSERGLRLRMAGIAVLASSAIPMGLTIYGIVGAVKQIEALREITAALNDGSMYYPESVIDDHYDRGVRLRAMAIASGVATGLMMYIGGSLIVYSRRSERSLSARLTLSPHPRGIALSGAF